MKAWDRDAMTDEERAWYDGTLRGQLDQLRRDAQRLGAVHVGAGLNQLEAKLADRSAQVLAFNPEEAPECGALNPSWPAEPGRCTLGLDHDGPHVHAGETCTLTWGW